MGGPVAPGGPLPLYAGAAYHPTPQIHGVGIKSASPVPPAPARGTPTLPSSPSGAESGSESVRSASPARRRSRSRSRSRSRLVKSLIELTEIVNSNELN